VDKESLKTKFFRRAMNLVPLYLGTGGKVLYIQYDWKHIKAQLKLNIWTRNYVGTIFGGSQFSAADPFFMLMLFNLLGKDYIVWDKSASIDFKKPGKKLCKADFIFTDAELDEIKQQATANGKYEFKKYVEWIDADGQVISKIERTLYVATKIYFKSRNEMALK
jgi:acyl-coenzyme A thioesterase PaaI-like protein